MEAPGPFNRLGERVSSAVFVPLFPRVFLKAKG